MSKQYKVTEQASRKYENRVALMRLAGAVLIVLAVFAYGPISQFASSLFPSRYGALKSMGLPAAVGTVTSTPGPLGAIVGLPTVTPAVSTATPTVVFSDGLLPTVTPAVVNPRDLVLTPNPGWTVIPGQDKVWPLPKH